MRFNLQLGMIEKEVVGVYVKVSSCLVNRMHSFGGF